MTKKFLSGIMVAFVLIIIGGLLFVVYRLNKPIVVLQKSKTPSDQFQGQNPTSSQDPKLIKNVLNYAVGDLPQTPGLGQVLYTESGFKPSIQSVKKGMIVTFFNLNKTKKLIVLSDGINGVSPELTYGKNIGFSFDKEGVFLVKNQLEPSKTITIKVN